jgi:hypothetical protein
VSVAIFAGTPLRSGVAADRVRVLNYSVEYPLPSFFSIACMKCIYTKANMDSVGFK